MLAASLADHGRWCSSTAARAACAAGSSIAAYVGVVFASTWRASAARRAQNVEGSRRYDQRPERLRRGHALPAPRDRLDRALDVASSTSRCVTARSTTGGSSRTARRLSASSANRLLLRERRDVELDEVRLDPLEIDREAGLGEPEREPRPAHGRRRADRRGGRGRRDRRQRRYPPGASRRRRGTSCGGALVISSAEPASSAPSGQPSPFERQSVTVSKRAADRRGVHPVRDRGVQQPRAVEVQAEPEPGAVAAQRVELVERPDRPPRALWVFSSTTRRARRDRPGRDAPRTCSA